MAEPIDVVAELLAAFPGAAAREFRGQRRVVVPTARLHDALAQLKRDHGFDMLVDITCVDYLNYRGDCPDCRGEASENGTVAPGARDRFGLVYLLANTETNGRLTVRAMVNDPSPRVPSVVDLWEGANWLEREVWDMFGIEFTGHPDLRRILLPEAFTSHPLRKDYPLEGRGERHNFPVITRGEG